MQIFNEWFWKCLHPLLLDRYGRVFKSHLFGSPTIVSCDHELNMVVLQNEEKLFQVSYPKAMHGILGKFSLLIVSGYVHKKLRNIGVSFIIASKSNPEFLDCVEKMTISMMNSWKNCKEIGFYKEVKKVGLIRCQKLYAYLNIHD